MACLRKMKKITEVLGLHLAEGPSHHPQSLEDTDDESQPPGWNEGSTWLSGEEAILCLAAIHGDWTTAKQILDRNPNYVGDRFTARNNETLLHMAVTGGNTLFVRNLVEMLEQSDLEIKNSDGVTAFLYAVLAGDVDNAVVMRDKNEKLPTIRAYDEHTPINFAAMLGLKKMASYLYTVTPFQELSHFERIELLEATILNDMYDMALDILNKDRRLAVAKLKGNRSFLHVLAPKGITVPGEEQGRIWRRFLSYTCLWKWNRNEEKCSSVDNEKAYELLEQICTEFLKLPGDMLSKVLAETEVLHYFAKEGHIMILDMMLSKKPDLLWEINSEGQSILHVAALHRQEEFFYLMYHIGYYRDLVILETDSYGNNILHLASKLGRNSEDHYEDDANYVNSQQPRYRKSSKGMEKILPQPLLQVSGAAFQLQRELLWFKEIGNVVPRILHNQKNVEKKTPKQLFSEEHRELKKEGEKWMRDTANYCMVAATLIATMVFAAAFTVPGGNNQETGIPIFIKRSRFSVFTISDGVAMFGSIVSIIMFLSILMSTYTEDDFRVWLPLKLLVGLTALFVAIVGMLVAFVLVYFSIYDMAWQPKLVTVIAGVPFALYMLLNYKVWYHTTKSIILFFLFNFKRPVR